MTEWPDDLARREAETCGDALGIDGAQLISNAHRWPWWRWIAEAMCVVAIYVLAPALVLLAAVLMGVLE